MSRSAIYKIVPELTEERLEFISSQVANGNLKVRRRAARRDVLQRLIDRIYLRQLVHSYAEPSEPVEQKRMTVIKGGRSQ